MAEVLLFHHALGQTTGFLAFADKLRAAGHDVHTPDLYDGKTFHRSQAGRLTRAGRSASATIGERGRLSRRGCRTTSSTAGSRSGCCRRRCWPRHGRAPDGALLFSAAFPASEFGGGWPPASRSRSTSCRRTSSPSKEDLDAARELEQTVEGAELFLYPGDRHLFADNSLPDYDEAAAALLDERVITFLKGVDDRRA